MGSGGWWTLGLKARSDAARLRPGEFFWFFGCQRRILRGDPAVPCLHLLALSFSRLEPRAEKEMEMEADGIKDHLRHAGHQSTARLC